jgi:hypothetical protein
VVEALRIELVALKAWFSAVVYISIIRMFEDIVPNFKKRLQCSKGDIPIPAFYLVPHLSMPFVHFKCIGECVSR